MLRNMATMDTQEIEGCNKLITSISSRCPNISLELLSSRVCMTKELMLGQRGVQHKWSAVQQRAARALRASIDYYSAASPVVNAAGRWSEAPAVAPVDRLAAAYAQLQEGALAARLWAAPYCLKWRRCWKALGVLGLEAAITFEAHDEEAFFCAEKFGHAGRWLPSARCAVCGSGAGRRPDPSPSSLCVGSLPLGRRPGISLVLIAELLRAGLFPKPLAP